MALSQELEQRVAERTAQIDMSRELIHFLAVDEHLHALTRTRSGRFTLEGVVTLPELEAKTREGRLGEVLMSIAEALAHLPAVRWPKRPH